MLIKAASVVCLGLQRRGRKHSLLRTEYLLGTVLVGLQHGSFIHALDSLYHSQFTDEETKAFSRIPRWKGFSRAMLCITSLPVHAHAHLWCSHQPHFPDAGAEVHGAYLRCLNSQSQKVSGLEFELKPFFLQNPDAS